MAVTPKSTIDNDLLECNFCGNRTLKKMRCAGCGGSSFTRVYSPGVAANPTDKLVLQVINAQHNLKYLILTLAVGLTSIAIFLYHSSRPDESTTKIEKHVEKSVVEYSKEEIRTLIADNISEDYRFLYTRIYSSPAKDNSITLHVKENVNPIVLVLTSYEAVTWNIQNPSNTDIRAIVFGSRKFGSTVSVEVHPSTMVLPHYTTLGRANMTTGCLNQSTLDTSERTFRILKAVEDLGSGTLSGITYETSVKTTEAPTQDISDQHLQALQTRYANCAGRVHSESSYD